MTFRMVSACSGRAGGGQQRPSPDCSHTRRSPSSALPVPSGSTAKRLGMLDQWRTERRKGKQRCLCEVQRLRTGMFNGINRNAPYRWKRSAPPAAPLGRKTLLSRAEMTRLSEHIMRGVRRPVPKCGDDQKLGAGMARRRGTRRPSQLQLGEGTLAWHVLELREAHQVRERTPQPCAAARQHAPAVRQLMVKHAVSADLVVDIDGTSCRHLPVCQIG